MTTYDDNDDEKVRVYAHSKLAIVIYNYLERVGKTDPNAADLVLSLAEHLKSKGYRRKKR